MRKLLLFLTLLLLPVLAQAQDQLTYPAESTNNTFTGTNTFNNSIFTSLAQFTVSTLPPVASVMTGLIVVVTDGQTASDCVTGGGTTAALCRSDGSFWRSLGGSGTGSAFYQTIETSGSQQQQRQALNFIPGTNTVTSCADNSGNSSTDCQVNVTGIGASVLGTDNIFTNNNRFAGPIPYIDFTSYMPAGGCSTPSTADPPATGTITSGSHTLALSSAAGFVTGCGLALDHAGPTATIVMASTASGTTTRVGTLVTFTITSGDPHLVPGIGNGTDAAGFVIVSGCSNTNFNTTGTGWLLNFGTPVTSFTYNSATSTGTSATGCTATFYTGWPHGVTGSTTWNYKVAPIDANGGLGTAVGPIAITNGNATLTTQNYNWIGFQYVKNARAYAIYRDDGAGGAYTCINLAYTPGFADWGAALPFGCPSFVPSTPPASPTAQTLNTTIASGGGTTSVTLTDAASNNATSQNVHYDNSMFLAECIDDVLVDQAAGGTTHGSAGCTIPYGLWAFNADMPTDTINGGLFGGVGAGVTIKVVGTPMFQSWPWMVGSLYQILGEGDGAGTIAGQNFHVSPVNRGARMPAGIVLRGSTVTVKNLALLNILGSAMIITTDPSTSANSAGITLDSLVLNTQDGFSNGVPMLIDGNTFFLRANNINFQPTCTSGFPASILFTTLAYDQNTSIDLDFTNIYTQWHHFVMDTPGGTLSGSGTGVNVTNWWSEEHGQCPTGGTYRVDAGTTGGTPGATPSGGVIGFITNMQNADASNKTLVDVTGTATGGKATVGLFNTDQFNTTVVCSTAGSQLCANGGFSLLVGSNDPQIAGGGLGYYQGPVVGGQWYMRYPLVTDGSATSDFSWSDILPAPHNLNVQSTGSGSLSAGTYYIKVVGLDFQPTPGFTLPTPELPVTVGASSSITLQYQLPSIADFIPAYSAFRVYFGTASGSENNYFTVSTQNSTNQSFVFTTTSGATSGTVPTSGTMATARSSWLGLGKNTSMCVACVSSNPSFTTPSFGGTQVGIGDPAPATGSKLSIKGGYEGFAGSTSGGFQIGANPVAGTPNPNYWPTASGSNGSVLTTDGGNPAQLSWNAPGAATWASNTAGTNSNAGTFAVSGNTWDFSGAAHTLPAVKGTVAAKPATCTVGEMYFATDATAGQNWYYCTTTNVWTQQLNSGTAGASTSLGNLITVAINTTLLPASVNTVALGSTSLPFTTACFGTVANQTGCFNTSSLLANRSIKLVDGPMIIPQPLTAVTHQFVTALNSTTGLLTLAQPAIGDISGITFSGNTTELGTVSGAVTTTHIATWDASGNLVDGGAPVTASSSTTFTNKPFNCEATGNSCSQTALLFFLAAGCNSSTAGPALDIGTTNQPTPQCIGTTTRKGVLAFARGNVAYFNSFIPNDYNSSSTVDIYLNFTTTDTTNGHITSFNVQTGCNKTDGTVTDDPTLNALQALSVTTGASQISGGQLTGKITGVTMTGCSPGYNFVVAITRNNSGTDTNTDTAVFVKNGFLNMPRTINATNR